MDDPRRASGGRNGAPAPLDWQQAHRRLEELGRTLDREISPEELAIRLRKRADALAAPPAAEVARRDIVVFGLGEQRYAVEVMDADGVVPVNHVVALPGTDVLHLGLLAHRGTLYALVDLNVLLDRPQIQRSGPPGFGILVNDPECAVALAADVIHGTRAVEAARLDAHAAHYAIVRAILSDGTNLLAIDALTRNARLVVDDRMRAIP
jgi:chemotaxis signal transduction protein